MAASKKLNQNLYALITGVTRSIGNELAKLLSRKDYQLILVASDPEDLQQVTERLQGVGGVEITPLNSREAAKQLQELDIQAIANENKGSSSKRNTASRVTTPSRTVLEKLGVDMNYMKHDYRDHYYDFEG